MDKINRLEEARTRLRSYNMAAGAAAAAPKEDEGIEQDHRDEAEGLSIAAMNIAATHSDDEVHDLHDSMSSEGDRSYAAATMAAQQPGKVLRASAKNPRVRRWVKTNALKNIGRHALHAAGTGAVAVTAAGATGGNIPAGLVAAGLVHALHDQTERSLSLGHNKHNATSVAHYGEHHADFVDQMHKRYGLRHGTIKHALAYHAHAEMRKQQREVVSKTGKLHPVLNGDISDKDFHKNLGGRAKSAFISGMIARHGK